MPKKLTASVTVTESVPARLKRDDQKSAMVQAHLDGLDNAMAETIGALVRADRFDDATELARAYRTVSDSLDERFELTEEEE